MASSETTRYICLFHDAARGRAALDALANAGFSRSGITVLGDTADTQDATTSNASLDALGVPDRDIEHLRQGLRNGGVLLALEAPEARSNDIEHIFSKYSADKIDETDLGATPAASRSVTQADSAVVPVVQEDLLVGKRAVDRGGVRVLRRVVEEPVNETLNLHEERVVIDRRPADRDLTSADMNAAGQVIELTETAEVPIVTKTARVVEEVRVGLEATDRTETVQDTVRHTEVEVEPIPGSDRRNPSRS